MTISSGGLVRDNKNNWQPSVTTEEQYKVYLRVKSNSRNTNYLPSQGVDSEAIELTGYLVNPMFFPEGFIIPESLPCELTMPSGDLMKGNFRLNIVPGNPASRIAGQEIQGTFTRER